MDDAVFVAVFHNGPLIFLDRYREAGGHAAGTGGFAQGGADPAGKFRVPVGGNQPPHRQVPLALIDQIIPLGNQVVQGAAADHASQHHAALAEGNAAVHTPGALGLLFIRVEGNVELLEVFNPFQGRHFLAGLPGNFHKSRILSHNLAPPYCAFFMA